jgi:hypothetical protein
MVAGAPVVSVSGFMGLMLPKAWKNHIFHAAFEAG